MAAAVDDDRIERAGRELGKLLVFEALSGRWRTKRNPIIEAAAEYLEENRTAAASQPPKAPQEETSRAGQIGQALATQLVRAAEAQPWGAIAAKTAVAAAARHLRFYLKQNSRPVTSAPELWQEAERN